MEWTEETISHLRSLWQEGHSTAEIGRRLSITKNAVVGKAHRLVLPPRQSPIRKPSEAAADARRERPCRREAAACAAHVLPAADQGCQVARQPPLPPLPASAAPAKAPVTPLRLVQTPPASLPREAGLPASGRRGQSCCWPLGDPGTKQFRFCGAEPMHGKPYCCEHAQLAYVKLRDRRDTVA